MMLVTAPFTEVRVGIVGHDPAEVRTVDRHVVQDKIALVPLGFRVGQGDDK